MTSTTTEVENNCLIDDDFKGKTGRLTYKNQSDADDDLIIESEDDSNFETILNLSSSKLYEIPSSITKEVKSSITTLILTNNHMRNLRSLEEFQALETLQLDRNAMATIDALPKFPNLHTLWLNNNKLSNLGCILTVLKKQCPKLEYLSLLLNEVCPVLEQGTESRYKRYRHSVIYNLPNLKFLDTEEISLNEKKAAAKKGKYLKVAKPDVSQLEQMEDYIQEESEAVLPYKNAEPAAFLGKGRVKYDGRESEGNRFILNQHL